MGDNEYEKLWTFDTIERSPTTFESILTEAVLSYSQCIIKGFYKIPAMRLLGKNASATKYIPFQKEFILHHYNEKTKESMSFSFTPDKSLKEGILFSKDAINAYLAIIPLISTSYKNYELGVVEAYKSGSYLTLFKKLYAYSMTKVSMATNGLALSVSKMTCSTPLLINSLNRENESIQKV